MKTEYSPLKILLQVLLPVQAFSRLQTQFAGLLSMGCRVSDICSTPYTSSTINPISEIEVRWRSPPVQ